MSLVSEGVRVVGVGEVVFVLVTKTQDNVR